MGRRRSIGVIPCFERRGFLLGEVRFVQSVLDNV